MRDPLTLFPAQTTLPTLTIPEAEALLPTGWRLPTIDELLSLVDWRVYPVLTNCEGTAGTWNIVTGGNGQGTPSFALSLYNKEVWSSTPVPGRTGQNITLKLTNGMLAPRFNTMKYACLLPVKI